MNIRNAKLGGGEATLYHRSTTELVELPDGSTLDQLINVFQKDIETNKTNIATNTRNISAHINNKSNPHNVSRNQIGLSKETLLSEIVSAIYPVGSILFTYTNKNPGTYLPGTTWVLTGSGRYIRTVNTADSNLNTVKTGGSKTLSLAHTHTIAAHSHTIAHTHSISAHSHTISGHTHAISSHTHTIASHSHTVNSHVHSTANHTLSLSQIPSHSGHVNPYINQGEFAEVSGGYYIMPGRMALINANMNGSLAPIAGSRAGLAAFDMYYGNEAVPRTCSYGSGGAHNHGNTGRATPGTSGVALTTAGTSLTTGNGGSGNTGTQALTTGGSSSANSGGTSLTTASGLSEVTNEPEYQTLYCWRRSA